MRGSGVQFPPAAPAKSGVQRKSMHSSAGSNEPERPVFDPLNADLCVPEIAILSAVSRRQIAGPIAPGDTLITTIRLLASNHCQFRGPRRTYRWPEATGPPVFGMLEVRRPPDAWRASWSSHRSRSHKTIQTSSFASPWGEHHRPGGDRTRLQRKRARGTTA